MIASIDRRCRATEFKTFLAMIDQGMAEYLDLHVFCDNYGTHQHSTVKNWLEKHLGFHVYVTPMYSSWITQVERLSAEVTRDLLNAPITAACKRWRRTSAIGSRYRRRTRSHSSVPGPPIRFLILWADY